MTDGVPQGSATSLVSHIHQQFKSNSRSIKIMSSCNLKLCKFSKNVLFCIFRISSALRFRVLSCSTGGYWRVFYAETHQPILYDWCIFLEFLSLTVPKTTHVAALVIVFVWNTYGFLKSMRGFVTNGDIYNDMKLQSPYNISVPSHRTNMYVWKESLL